MCSTRTGVTGDVYLAPYVTFEPSLAFVAQDAEGWPALRARHPEPSPEVAGALPTHERNALQNIHHPWGTADELASRFPSHMHIDLLPRIQARGIGRLTSVRLEAKSASASRCSASAHSPGGW